MKVLLSITIWLAAVLLAVWVLYRLIRNKPTLLHGRIARRAIRIAAVVMVALGIGGCGSGDLEREAVQAEPAADAPAQSRPEVADEPAPEVLRALARELAKLMDQVGPAHWHQVYLSGIHGRLPDAEASRHLRRVLDHAASRAKDETPPEPLSAATIAQALQEMQQDAYLFSEPFNLLLWHELQALPAPADAEEAAMLAAAMGRVHDNARMLNTLTRAQFESGLSLRNDPRAWMSKAAPAHPSSYVDAEDVEAFGAAVESLYATSDAGLWLREGVLQLTADADAGSIAIIRQRHPIKMEAGSDYRVGRLDLLQTDDAGGRLNSDWLGEIELPANAALRMGDLPALLDDVAHERIDEAIAQAAKGDEDALLLLERHMPLCVPQIVEAIPQLDQQEAAGLRLLVYLYDPMLNESPQMWRYFEPATNERHEGAGWMDSGPLPGTLGGRPQGGGPSLDGGRPSSGFGAPNSLGPGGLQPPGGGVGDGR